MCGTTCSTPPGLPGSQAALESRQTDGKPSHRNTSGVVVEGIDSCMLKFSRCCTPVPGDEIIGFVTKGYGVSIHRKDCPNAQGSLDPAQQGRWVKVSWANDENESFYTTLEIESTDRDGLWLDVTNCYDPGTGKNLRALRQGPAWEPCHYNLDH